MSSQVSILNEERPSYICFNNGLDSMANYHLIAALIGGDHSTAQEKAKILLNHCDESLRTLSRMNVREIQRVASISKDKATAIISALELGRRKNGEFTENKPRVTCSRYAYNAIFPMLEDLPHEEFWVLYLNKAKNIIGRERISKGGVAGTVVDLKLLFKACLENMASAIIVCHNHPSGNLQPSQADLNLTKNIKTVGQSLDMPLLDHIIVGGISYFSFADEGLI